MKVQWGAPSWTLYIIKSSQTFKKNNGGEEVNFEITLNIWHWNSVYGERGALNCLFCAPEQAKLSTVRRPNSFQTSFTSEISKEERCQALMCRLLKVQDAFSLQVQFRCEAHSAVSMGHKVTIQLPSPARPPGSGLAMSNGSTGCQMAQSLGWWAASAPWCGLERCQLLSTSSRRAVAEAAACMWWWWQHREAGWQLPQTPEHSHRPATAATTQGESGDRLSVAHA